MRFKVLPCLLFSLLPATSRGDTPIPAITPDHLALSSGSKVPAVNYQQSLVPGQFFRVNVKNSCSAYTFKKLILENALQDKKYKERLGAISLKTFGADCVLRDLAPYEVTYDGTAAGYILTLSASHPNMTALQVTPTIGADADDDEIDTEVLKQLTDAKTKAEQTGECKDVADADEKDECSTAAAVKSVGTLVSLKDLTIVVAVSSAPPINLDFAGAFTVSFLTDPVFALHGPTGNPPTYTVVEEAGSRDTARPGVAAMVHASFPHIWDGYPTLTFGIGINTNSRVDYYFGLGVRAYGQFFLTVGVDIGQKSRLPNGIDLNATVTDANALSNLPTRTSGAFFFGLSYAFISTSKDVFTKPFQPVAPSPAPPK